LIERLRTELQSLTDEERKLLELRFDRRLSTREIAMELGVGFSAAAVRLHRLIAKLRVRLGPPA
jgi:RNA polymerase sigma factor (sigma-70 family)